MNMKFLVCAAFGMMLTTNVFAQDEVDVTEYIINAGFDEDITFNPDGTAATEITATGATTSRSKFYKAENGSLYAWPTDNLGFNAAGANSWYGFIGYMHGWEVTNTTQTPEWIYFGSVPYAVQSQMLGVGDGNPAGSVENPGKPEGHEGDDNTGLLYFRAGWGGSCSYKQVVSLPCAEYRLEYWSINANANSTAEATNLTKVTCRKDVFQDETGLTDKVWTKHEIIFTPTTEFTIEFGYKSANSNSNSNPWVFIDGIKLYKIGEADQEELLASDLMDMVDSLYTLLGDARLEPFTGLQTEISDITMDAENASTVEEMTEAIAMLNQFAGVVVNLFPTIEEYNGLYTQALAISETSNPYPGYDAFMTAYNKITGEIESATTENFATLTAELKTAINTYNVSQEASEENPADYTFYVSAPNFTKIGFEPVYDENGVATYPNVPEDETLTAGTAPSFADKGNWNNTGYVTSGDQRLNFVQGRVAWNLWDNHAGVHAVKQDLTDLPNGYYTVTADMITQPDYVHEAHVFAQSSVAEVASPFLTEGNWSDANDGKWTTLTTEKVIVADGKLTIGGKSNFPEANQKGWFNITNVKLNYLGAFKAEDFKVIYDKTIADAQAMCDTMMFKGDKKTFSDSIAAYNNAENTVEAMNEALAHINAAKDVAQASIDKWIGVNTGSWANLKDSIAAGVYTAEAQAMAQKVVDFMTAYVATDTASYVYMDAKTEILRKYRDSYLPTFMNVQVADYKVEAAKAVIAGTIAQNIKELADITDFPTVGTMDGLIASLNAAIAEADRLETLNAQQPGENVDYTALIKNADINADSNGTGWTISKGQGNTNTAAGQQFDGDGNGRYLDSYNGTAGALNYTAYQTLENIPNGKYAVKAMTRTSGNGAYMYAIADNDTVNGVFKQLKSNEGFNYTQWVDPIIKDILGNDSIMTTTDKYGPIWMESITYVRDVLGVQTTVEPESGQTVVDFLGEWVATNEGNMTEEQTLHTNIVLANDGAGRGWAWNTIEVEVKNHVLVIGVSTDSTFTVGHKDVDGADCVPFTGTWFSADNFSLTMLTAGDNTGWEGTETGIENVTDTENAVPVAIYSINGVRVATPAKGINIIKMSDGTVKKVLVK